MIGGMVGNMIAEGQGGVGAGDDANKALVSLDLAKGAPGKPLHPRFEIGPEDIPFALTLNGRLFLQMVNPCEGSSGVGVDERSAGGRAGRVLHGNG